jgi:hypothetical protein
MCNPNPDPNPAPIPDPSADPAPAAVDAVCGRRGTGNRSINATQGSVLLDEDEDDEEVEKEVGESGTEGSAVEGGDSAGRVTDDDDNVSNFLFSPYLGATLTSA